MSALATRLSDAVTMHRASRFPEAEAAYRAVLKKDRSNADATMLLGVLCGQTGRADEAIDLLGIAARLRPRDASVHYNLGSILRESGRLDEAARSLETACELAPTHASARFNLAATLLDLGRADEAVASFRAAIHVEPSHHRAKHQLASLLADRGETLEAAELWRSAIDNEPGHPDYHLNLGLAAFAQSRFDESVRAFERVTQLAPQSAVGWCNLGSALRLMGRFGEAAESLERAVELDPELVEARLNLIRALLDLKSTRRAMKVCLELAAREPDDWRTLLAQSRVMSQAGEFEAAETFLRRAAANRRDSSEPLVELGHLLRRAGRFDEAIAVYRQVPDGNAAHVEAGLGLIQVHLSRDDVDAAQRIADQVRRVSPEDAGGILAFAECQRSAGRVEEAAALLAEAIANPKFTRREQCDFHFAMAHCLDKLKRFDEAWRHVERANELVPVEFDRGGFRTHCAALRTKFSRDALRSAPVCAAQAPAPIFIVGMPRTGSTLIEQILCSHSAIAPGGEMSLLSRIASRAASGSDDPDSTVDRIAAATREKLDPLAAFGNSALRKAAGDRSLVTEKTPGSILWLGLADMLFPNARVIFSLRDPLDTCLSCYFTHFAGHHPFAYDLEDLGFYHREHARIIEHWRESLRVPTMTMQYEELVADQERCTRDLLAFCGATWEDRCLAFHENPRIAMTASIDQVRKPIYTSSVNRSRNYEKHLDPLRAALAAASAV